MASNTDLFKKLARRWVGQIGSGGVADASTTTVPLASSTNLPTGTAVVVVVDRVDSNGTTTASLEETIIGVVSGNNLVNCVRGAEGTAQAHDAGAVVEVLVTAKGWNDLIDGLLVQHDQLGYHTNITASNITASATVTASHINVCDITPRSIVYTASPSADDIFHGITATLTAAAATAQWEVGYMNSSSKVALADADAIATSSALFLATAAIDQDAAGAYLLNGIARNDGWNWTAGGLLYLSTTAGAITQTAPSGADDVIQILGVALTADVIYWNPQLVQVEHTG